MKKKVKIGLENFIEKPPGCLSGKRLGLLCNPASVNSQFHHAKVLIHRRFPGQLKALFSPQHGFYAEKQDNMIESGHFTEPELKIPVFSLYHDSRIPTEEMFDEFDILLVDIQDVGTRVYTFIYTISYCLEAAARYHKKVLILDRPNPVGGSQLEGNILSDNCSSFVGRFPIPMRHGLTVGEISKLFNSEFNINCDLQVIPMLYWQRYMYFSDTGLPWIAPSPNLPTAQSCMVYPGQVIFEGTNISEGRGTTLPFEQFGSPFLDIKRIKDEVEVGIHGAVLRPIHFEPMYGKWQGKICKGFQVHVTEKENFNAYLSSLILLQAIIKFHPDEFKFKEPPYEYEFERMPIDLILGSESLRKRLCDLKDLQAIAREWEHPIKEFKSLSRRYHLYE
jgi:uncharacterized protein YbbC (DUF1343 family)